MAKRSVTYSFETPINGIRKARFELGTITVAQLGQYNKLDEKARKLMNEEAGGDVTKMTDEQRDEIDPAILSRYGVRRQWAYILVAMRAVYSLTEDATEMRISLEDLGWGDMRNLDDLPIDLLSALARYAVMCNPRVFNGAYVAEEELAEGQEKKFGVIATS